MTFLLKLIIAKGNFACREAVDYQPVVFYIDLLHALNGVFPEILHRAQLGPLIFPDFHPLFGQNRESR